MPIGVYIRNEKYREKVSKRSKGRKHTEETKQKMSESQKGNKNHMYGKHLSEETKQKLRETLKGRRFSKKHRERIAAALKGKRRPEQVKIKLSKMMKKLTGEKSRAWKGGDVSFLCKTCGKEKKIKKSALRKSGNFCSYSCNSIWQIKNTKKKDTSIEIAIEQELIKRHIPYLKQAPIEGVALVDFLLADKVIIQCDGDYWHSRKINRGKDIAQDTVLFFKGYKVFRFWEKDIKKSAKECLDRIY